MMRHKLRLGEGSSQNIKFKSGIADKNQHIVPAAANNNVKEQFNIISDRNINT